MKNTIKVPPLGIRIDETAIAVGQSRSAPLNLIGRVLKRVQVPANATGTHLCFRQADHDEATEAPVGALLRTYDSEGALIEVPAGGARMIELHPALFAATFWVQLEMTDGAGNAVVQTGSPATFGVMAVML